MSVETGIWCLTRAFFSLLVIKMITTKLYKGTDAIEGANLALKWRLFVSGWQLSYVFKNIRERGFSQGKFLALVFLNDMPVSVAVAVPFNHGYELQTFTKKEYRLRGYASKAIEALNLDPEAPRYASIGIDGTELFWHKHGVPNPW